MYVCIHDVFMHVYIQVVIAHNIDHFISSTVWLFLFENRITFFLLFLLLFAVIKLGIVGGNKKDHGKPDEENPQQKRSLEHGRNTKIPYN